MQRHSFEQDGLTLSFLDDGGNGHSDHAATYTRGDYLGDVNALFTCLAIDRAVVLGNSLGGVNAYQLAARRPERVVAPYLRDSFRQTPEGWQLAFDPQDMEASQRSLNGDHWVDWLASTCPALLVHGRESPVTKLPELEQMAARRPNTTLRTIEGGHVVHVDNPAGFTTLIREFLRYL